MYPFIIIFLTRTVSRYEGTVYLAMDLIWALYEEGIFFLPPYPYLCFCCQMQYISNKPKQICESLLGQIIN